MFETILRKNAYCEKDFLFKFLFSYKKDLVFSSVCVFGCLLFLLLLLLLLLLLRPIIIIIILLLSLLLLLLES